MGGISIWQLLIVAVIVILLFGTKKLRNIGGDLGSAIKGFKKAMVADDDKKDADFAPEKLEEKNNTMQKDEAKTETEIKNKEKV